ncbi:g4789 [Coccomyxa elongata]
MSNHFATSRHLVRTRAGYRWGRGTGGRRKRESLLDNVDPTQDLEASGDNSMEETGTDSFSRVDSKPSTSANGWAKTSQNGTGSRSTGPQSQNGRSAWRSSNTADDNGWSAGPQPEAEEWGWGTDRGRPWGAKKGSSDVWQTNNGASTPADDGSSGAESTSEAAADGARGEAWDDAWDEDGPDIVELRPEEVAMMLPVTPTAEQIQHCSGDSAVLWQRLGISLLATLVTLKVSALAAGSLTFPLWFPSLQATLRNRNVRAKFRHVGLWRAAVVDVALDVRFEPRFREPRARGPAGAESRLLRLLVGDASGARSELSVPYDRRYDAIRVGEPAEVLVLSKLRTFETFKALKEVYLPECGVWVSDYPYLNREAFLDISLEVERERQQEMAM